MRTLRRIFFLAVLLALLGGIVWFIAVPSQPPEPIYQGKPLTYWLFGYLSGKTLNDYQSADLALQQAGTNAIPTLFRLLCSRDSGAKGSIIRWFQQHPRIRTIFGKTAFQSADMKHIEALTAFNRLGANARPAVPELVQILETNPDDDTAFLSFQALAQLRTNAAGAVPELIRLYEANPGNPINGHEQLALMCLASLGPAADSAIPSLLQMATNSAADMTRLRALGALGALHSQPEIVVPALINLMQDQNTPANIRDSAIMVLADYGAEARPALPVISNLLHDPAYPLRIDATNALRKIIAAPK